MVFEMDPKESQALNSKLHIRKSLQEIMEELTTSEKILIYFSGWKHVCLTLEYIFQHFCGLFDDISGITFDYDGLTQIVGNVCAATNLEKKVLIGGTFKTTASSYKLDDERNVEILEGFDDLDRTLKKLSIWGCNFIILQVKLGCSDPFGARLVPFDNKEYFGIFSATAQALGMVPIIQFQYEPSCTEEDRVKVFVDAMYTINQSLYDFEVDTSCLLISPLISFKSEACHDGSLLKAETLIHSLKQALPPAIGGVVVASEGSPRAQAFQIDQLSKIIDRIPWPITCCHEWRIPTIPDLEDPNNLVLEKWVKQQILVIKILLLASKGHVTSCKGKLTVGTADFITTHDYYDQAYHSA